MKKSPSPLLSSEMPRFHEDPSGSSTPPFSLSSEGVNGDGQMFAGEISSGGPSEDEEFCDGDGDVADHAYAIPSVLQPSPVAVKSTSSSPSSWKKRLQSSSQHIPQHYLHHHSRLPVEEDEDEEDDNSFFLSDASISEEGDASSGNINIRRAPHRVWHRQDNRPKNLENRQQESHQQLLFLPSTIGATGRVSTSDDDVEDYYDNDDLHKPPTPPPLPSQSVHHRPQSQQSNRRLTPVPSGSPGNTSLSSWDMSPYHKQQSIHFSWAPPERNSQTPTPPPVPPPPSANSSLKASGSRVKRRLAPRSHTPSSIASLTESKQKRDRSGAHEHSRPQKQEQQQQELLQQQQRQTPLTYLRPLRKYLNPPPSSQPQHSQYNGDASIAMSLSDDSESPPSVPIVLPKSKTSSKGAWSWSWTTAGDPSTFQPTQLSHRVDIDKESVKAIPSTSAAGPHSPPPPPPPPPPRVERRVRSRKTHHQHRSTMNHRSRHRQTHSYGSAREFRSFNDDLGNDSSIHRLDLPRNSPSLTLGMQLKPHQRDRAQAAETTTKDVVSPNDIDQAVAESTPNQCCQQVVPDEDTDTDTDDGDDDDFVLPIEESDVEKAFANFGKQCAQKLPRQRFFPNSTSTEERLNKHHRYYTCSRCGTRQREFITVASAPDSGPPSYLALYFALYITAALFIFGLEEGWKPLDCIYFAVITLTTCGLGDFVPTTPVNKLICSVFIYFGVACIGLLLGSYITNFLDEKALRDRMSRQIGSCQYCQMMKHNCSIHTSTSAASIQRRRSPDHGSGALLSRPELVRFQSERPSNGFTRSAHVGVAPKISHPDTVNRIYHSTPPGTSITKIPDLSLPAHSPLNSSASMSMKSILSPVTRGIRGRQGHTRHESIDLNLNRTQYPQVRRDEYQSNRYAVSGDGTLASELTHLNPTFEKVSTVDRALRSFYPPFATYTNNDVGNDEDDDNKSDCSETSESTAIDIIDDKTFRFRAAKFVFMTIRQALVNSLLIIAFGCLGFWFIEGFPIIDCWYFTTVLLTTTGYGDITPYTRGGKLFATVYLLVGGSILLNNMSLISTIPVELRRQRIERAVLTQFGDELDDEALRELAIGPTVQRLHLAANRPDGLNECTREMFSLAMLVRLGKVSEEDIKETFAAFRRLDVNNEGVLNSKSIIAAMIHRRRGSMLRCVQAPCPPPPSPPTLPNHPFQQSVRESSVNCEVNPNPFLLSSNHNQIQYPSPVQQSHHAYYPPLTPPIMPLHPFQQCQRDSYFEGEREPYQVSSTGSGKQIHYSSPSMRQSLKGAQLKNGVVGPGADEMLPVWIYPAFPSMYENAPSFHTSRTNSDRFLGQLACPTVNESARAHESPF